MNHEKDAPPFYVKLVRSSDGPVTQGHVGSPSTVSANEEQIQRLAQADGSSIRPRDKIQLIPEHREKWKGFYALHLPAPQLVSIFGTRVCTVVYVTTNAGNHGCPL